MLIADGFDQELSKDISIMFRTICVRSNRDESNRCVNDEFSITFIYSMFFWLKMIFEISKSMFS